MADITMCNNKTCNKRNNCYRFTANPSEFQYWFNGEPGSNDECDYFWDNTKTVQV